MTNENTETCARRIIKRLKMFNRKERDHLMKFALCENPGAPRISNALWKKISNGGTRPNPDAMFVGMDYHLNWLYAAMATAQKDETDLEGELKNEWRCSGPANEEDKNFRPIQDNQEDVDLLIAWFDRRWAVPLRFILVEAKLDSSWDSKQFKRKRERLTLIKEDADQRGFAELFQWNFMLLSPGRTPSKGVFAHEAPHDERYEWMYRDINGKPKMGLWHEQLPKVGGMCRVKRTEKSSIRWEIQGITDGANS